MASRSGIQEQATSLMLKSLDVFTRPLEAAFGGPLDPDGSPFVAGDVLTTSLLRQLFTNRICGIRVPSFCSPELCARLRAYVLNECPVNDWPVRSLDGRYEKSDTQYGIGLPLSEALTSAEKRNAYFREAVPSIRRLRATAEPGLAPIDRLRLELDEAWSYGAHVRHHGGRCMFTGIARVMRPENLMSGVARSEGVCHVDTLPVPSRRRGVFSANVYLDVPRTGGELDIWNISPSKWGFLRNYSVFKRLGDSFNDASQRALRQFLPAPIRVKPEPGDLVLINAGRPHAVRGFDEGIRVTVQSFILYEDKKPLQVLA